MEDETYHVPGILAIFSPTCQSARSPCKIIDLAARSWREVEMPLRPYQEYALEAWASAGMRAKRVFYNLGIFDDSGNI
jgi:superfamily II DNA or RNA helicase